MQHFHHVLCICLLKLVFLIVPTVCSIGDSSPFFQNCLMKCQKENCTGKGEGFQPHLNQPLVYEVFRWNCIDECTYNCMWKTVEAFEKRSWNVPQFYGKWPFLRIFGLQEPASAIFSFFNLYANWKMLKRFRKEVRPDSPYYWLWHFYCVVTINCWFWSTVFHSRDFPFTELMDYTCAFSTVLAMCFCMTIRVVDTKRNSINVFLTVIFLIFFANHAAYLTLKKRIDYGYNMMLNILVGTLTAISWFAWCIYNRKRLPYVWKCALFVALNGVFLSLEVIDKPPLFWIFDSHAFWHLSSIPLQVIFYNFVIDDCRYLRKEAFLSYESRSKEEIKKLIKHA